MGSGSFPGLAGSTLCQFPHPSSHRSTPQCPLTRWFELQEGNLNPMLQALELFKWTVRTPTLCPGWRCSSSRSCWLCKSPRRGSPEHQQPARGRKARDLWDSSLPTINSKHCVFNFTIFCFRFQFFSKIKKKFPIFPHLLGLNNLFLHITVLN